jgi:selenocysteine lyase/cysteine desulfurase
MTAADLLTEPATGTDAGPDRGPRGGTVGFVDPVGQRYLEDPVAREEAGTPAIVESVRAGLSWPSSRPSGPT